MGLIAAISDDAKPTEYFDLAKRTDAPALLFAALPGRRAPSNCRYSAHHADADLASRRPSPALEG